MSRLRKCLCVILGLLWIMAAAPISAGDDDLTPEIVEVPLPNWALPDDLCSGEPKCFPPSVRISENNVLYTSTKGRISAYYPDGSEPVLIPEAVLPYGVGLGWDYEPLGEEYLLYFGLSIPGYDSFYLQDLQTGDITKPISTGFRACTDRSFFPSDRSFYRLGKRQTVLACGKRNNVYVIDMASQRIEETISWTNSAEHFNPYFLAGENEQLYMFTTNGGITNEVLDQFVPSLDYQSYPKLTTFVLHRPLSATEWNVIAIHEDDFGTRPELEGIASLLSRFIVDQVGNIYYYVEWTSLENKQTDLVKFSPQGERVWRVTEAEMGGYTYLLDFLDDGSLLFWQDNTLKAYQITPRSDVSD